MDSIGGIAHVIQITVAPVFLLTGIGAILGGPSSRLGRITDRARLLEERIPKVAEEGQRDWLRTYSDLLWRCIRMIHCVIRLSVGAALCICLVAALFVAAMLRLIGGLLLIEASLSTRRTRQELEAFLAGHLSRRPLVNAPPLS